MPETEEIFSRTERRCNLTQLFGKENAAYRGGVTKLRTLIRNSLMYRQWKELVYQRDRYKCIDCGERFEEKELNAHHTTHQFSDILQEFIAKYPKYESPRDDKILVQLASCYAPFWSLKIAKTLCKKCHHAEHERLGDVGK